MSSNRDYRVPDTGDYKSGNNISYLNFAGSSYCNCNDNGVAGIDPQFADYSQHASVNISLDDNDTVAKDKAVTLTDFNYDRDGNIRNGIWDIGAYEGESSVRLPRAPEDPNVESMENQSKIN